MAGKSGGYAAGREADSAVASRQPKETHRQEKHGLGRDRFSEIVRSYADILRVGSLTVNGVLMTWPVSGALERDLDSFCEAFLQRLRHSHSSVALDPEILPKTIYWICKALSINYVLFEVLSWLTKLLKVKEDHVVTIPTEEKGRSDSRVDYFVDVIDGGFRLRAGLKWSWTGNIVEVAPTGSKVVRGTLSSIRTEFDCPPALDFKPTYSLRLTLKKSRSGRVADTVRGAAKKVVGRSAEPKASSFHVDASLPLRSRLSEDPFDSNRPPDYVLNARAEEVTESQDARLMRHATDLYLPDGRPVPSLLEMMEAGLQTPSFGILIDPDFGIGDDEDSESTDEEASESHSAA